ncbi:MAG: superoxide dismutase family protein [Balneolaceae bacterium]|nr:superoxide dismutase family protein [Balneolaceae bacterium]
MKSILFYAITPLLFLSACMAPETSTMEEVEGEVTQTSMSSEAPARLIAVVHPTEGNSASGVVRFDAVEGGVQVSGEIAGISPGLHGFHIHQYGDCSAANGTSAGGHYNPAGVDHAGPEAEVSHMGDLGNIEANAEGIATFDALFPAVDMAMITGRGLIVHAGEDDLETQPTGAAGARLGCGVIGVAAMPSE